MYSLNPDLFSFLFSFLLTSMVFFLSTIWHNRNLVNIQKQFNDEMIIYESRYKVFVASFLLFVLSFFLVDIVQDAIYNFKLASVSILFITIIFIGAFLSLLMLSYTNFYSIIVTNKRIIVKALFNSFLIKNIDIKICDIKSFSSNHANNLLLTLNDDSNIDTPISFLNKKVIEHLNNR